MITCPDCKKKVIKCICNQHKSKCCNARLGYNNLKETVCTMCGMSLKYQEKFNTKNPTKTEKE